MVAKDYTVRWKHIRPVSSILNASYTKLSLRELTAKQRKLAAKEKNATICQIIHIPSKTVVAESVAECSIKDTFIKKIGRKVSFTQAVNKLEDKEVRQYLWDKSLKSLI